MNKLGDASPTFCRCLFVAQFQICLVLWRTIFSLLSLSSWQREAVSLKDFLGSCLYCRVVTSRRMVVAQFDDSQATCFRSHNYTLYRLQNIPNTETTFHRGFAPLRIYDGGKCGLRRPNRRFYSWRRACSGSTFVARRAGM